MSKKSIIITGPNGSGKTTYLNSFANVSCFKEQSTFSYIQQSIKFKGSLRHNIFLYTRAFGENFIKDDLKRLLSETKAIYFMDRKYKTLSEGQKKIFNIIICITIKADNYVLDEFDISMDKKIVKVVKKWIKKLSTKNRFILSTHSDVDQYWKDFKHTELRKNEPKRD